MASSGYRPPSRLWSVLAPAAVLVTLAVTVGGSAAPDARLAGLSAAPSPPSAQACVPAGPGAAGISAGGGIQYVGTSDLIQELDGLQALGARWLRFDIAWSDIQPNGPDSYNWSRYDAVVAAASARHIAVLGMIGYTPQWAAPAGATSDKFPPRDPADYARFAAAAARRYAPMGVHTWEIWNEPNNSAFWMPAPSVAKYASMLRQAYTAIKAVDPAAVVLSGGTAPEATTSNSISPVDFLRGLYADGAGGYFDAVAAHPYTFPGTPLEFDPSSAWSQMNRTTPSMRSVMVQHGDGAKKIWVTEFGAPTADDVVTDAQQASMIAQAYDLLRSQLWAGPLFVYSYEDLAADGGSQDLFGLLRVDGSRKPSWLAFREAATAYRTECRSA